MKRLFVINIAMFCCVVLAFAQDNVQPDAIYKLIRHEYTINDNGTIDYHFRKEIKLLRNRAITAYADKGETFIVYNPEFETLKINESYTIRKDGTKVQTPKNAFVEQLPSSCQNCGRFNGIKELAIIHTGLEYDAVIVLDYTIHKKTDKLFTQIQIIQDCPVQRFEVSVNAANGKYDALLTKGMLIGDLMEQIAKTSYYLVGNNLPQNYNDLYLPPSNVLYPYLTITTGNAKEDEGQFVKYDNQSVLKEASSVLSSLYNSDTNQYSKDIKQYVDENVSLNNLPIGLLDYKVAPAKETWQSNCGTKEDKNQLTISLLKTAGLNTEMNNEKGKSVSSKIDTTFAFNGEKFADNYEQMTLKDVNAMGIDASMLTPSREAPLYFKQCSIDNHYTILLPKGAKMLNKQTNIYKNVAGIEMNISVKQINDSIEIRRSVMNNQGDVTISKVNYADFRSMMIDWKNTANILIKY